MEFSGNFLTHGSLTEKRAMRMGERFVTHVLYRCLL